MTDDEIADGLLAKLDKKRTHTSEFEFGDRVLIDGDRSLVGTVTGFTFRRDGYATVEVSWIHNGSSQSAWFEHWRLTVRT